VQIQRGIFLAAAGRDEDAFRVFQQVLELNPAIAPAHGFLAVHYAARGELKEALVCAQKASALTPQVPNSIGMLAGLLSRTGDAERAEELLGKLSPDAFGGPRARAIYHWVRGEIDAMAEWIEKAIDQRDPSVFLLMRSWFGRDLRSTPHWARLMRKLNLPEA